MTPKWVSRRSFGLSLRRPVGRDSAWARVGQGSPRPLRYSGLARNLRASVLRSTYWAPQYVQDRTRTPTARQCCIGRSPACLALFSMFLRGHAPRSGTRFAATRCARRRAQRITLRGHALRSTRPLACLRIHALRLSARRTPQCPPESCCIFCPCATKRRSTTRRRGAKSKQLQHGSAAAASMSLTRL